MTKLKLMDNGHMSISGSDKKNLELGISRSTMVEHKEQPRKDDVMMLFYNNWCRGREDGLEWNFQRSQLVLEPI